MCVFKYHAFIFYIWPPRWRCETGPTPLRVRVNSNVFFDQGGLVSKISAPLRTPESLERDDQPYGVLSHSSLLRGHTHCDCGAARLSHKRHKNISFVKRDEPIGPFFLKTNFGPSPHTCGSHPPRDSTGSANERYVVARGGGGLMALPFYTAIYRVDWKAKTD